jgi:hypothetical protein
MKFNRRSGFHYELPDSLPVPTVNEESGDVCSGAGVSGDDIERRLTSEGGNEWLKANAKWIKGCFGLEVTEREYYEVKSVVRWCRSVLHQLLGWGLVRPKQNVREWWIEAPSKNSMLELAYAIRHRHAAVAGLSTDSPYDLGDWDVRVTLEKWKPEFQWTLLTGVHPPYVQSHAAARAANASVDDEPLEEQGMHQEEERVARDQQEMRADATAAVDAAVTAADDDMSDAAASATLTDCSPLPPLASPVLLEPALRGSPCSASPASASEESSSHDVQQQGAVASLL